MNQRYPGQKYVGSPQIAETPRIGAIWWRAYQSLKLLLGMSSAQASTQGTNPGTHFKPRSDASPPSREALSFDVFLQSVPQEVTRKVLMSYSIVETVSLLRLFSVETRLRLLASLERDGPVYHSLDFYLENVTETVSQSVRSKSVQEFVFDLIKGIAQNGESLLAHGSRPAPKERPGLGRATTRELRASASSLTLAPTKPTEDKHLAKAILLYSFENPIHTSKKVVAFLSGVGLDLNPLQVKAVWKRYDLQRAQQRLQWATQGDDNATQLQREAAAIIREHS